jgi:cell division cycle 20-like protein 1 (cofactor of APC complex)
MNGRMHIYDASTQQCIRSYQDAHEMRIGALGWTSNVLTSGSRDRQIHHRDVREPGGAPWKRSVAHRQEVCGLKWSGDGAPHAATLASGGNDNKVCIWDLRGSRRAPDNAPDVPLWKFHEHTAAVKALAWDPHVSGLLASGGGTQDKHIRFWNVLNGQMLHELDSGSQVRRPLTYLVA